MRLVIRGRWDGRTYKWVTHMGSGVMRPRQGVLPVERLVGYSASRSVPDSNGLVKGSGDDVAPIGRGSNGIHPVGVPHERIADCSTSLGIPDSNGVVVGSRDDAAPIGRVSN